MILISTLTCPHCGNVSDETMPTDACVNSHRCAGCGVSFTP